MLTPEQLAKATPEELAEIDKLLAAPVSFRDFIRRADPAFQWYRAQHVIADALEASARGECPRLMVFMPPQEGKSQLVTRLFPAYYLTQWPDRWVGVGSYSFPLARSFSKAAREFYRGVVPSQGGGASEAVELWETARGGGLWAVGRGGSAVGRPAHLFVVDDPLKDREEAESETIRETLHNWYNGVVRMRLQPKNAVVIVHTRWHEDDLSGHLLELEKTTRRPERWHVIELPGIAEATAERPVYPPSVTVYPDWRRPGEPLGGRYGASRYEELRENAGTREYESQIQQRPGAAAGTILKRHWWPRVQPKDVPAPDRTIVSVDCAFKDAADSDFVAIQVWSRTGARVYGRYRCKERLSFTATVDKLAEVLAEYPQAACYVEDKANGPAVIDALTHRLLSVLPVTPEGGKTARAYACQGDVEYGRVLIPVGDGWDEFIRECASFPNGLHDDEVDAFTQAMAVFRMELREEMRTQRVTPVDRHPGFDPETHHRLHPAQQDRWRTTGGGQPVRPRMPFRGGWR